MNIPSFLSDPAFYALLVTGLFFFVGFVSRFIPILPAGALIWAGIVLHKLWLWDRSVSWSIVAIATVLMLAGVVADYLCTVWGARRFGASWRGAIGALIGGIVALFIPPQLLTLIIGPFLGAVLAELLGGSLPRPAFKAGIGTLVGGLVAFALKFSLSISMILLFWFSLPPN